MNKHKWYNEIIAWAEGKHIQYKKSGTSDWNDYLNDSLAPSFSIENDYRVKPNIIKYRLYLRSNYSVPAIIDYAMVYCANNEDADIKSSTIEECSSFAKWLTDWIEIEVEE